MSTQSHLCLELELPSSQLLGLFNRSIKKISGVLREILEVGFDQSHGYIDQSCTCIDQSCTCVDQSHYRAVLRLNWTTLREQRLARSGRVCPGIKQSHDSIDQSHCPVLLRSCLRRLWRWINNRSYIRYWPIWSQHCVCQPITLQAEEKMTGNLSQFAIKGSDEDWSSALGQVILASHWSKQLNLLLIGRHN